MEERPGVGELCGRHRLQQWRELCLSGRPWGQEFHPAPWHLQGRPRRVYVHQGRRPLPMSPGQGDTVQESVPGQPYQDQKEGVPRIEQDLQGLCVTGYLFGQGARETVLGHLS
ncbi:hypothetical protein LCGC14_1133770 [marine sediment metagenome]|uniref:Uncharacterized protein n=1 Tax=marine sediment metagenome TaxID=412755 RepID=A0A0F9MN93_9ZZZZ